jgi:hypothetical protein
MNEPENTRRQYISTIYNLGGTLKVRTTASKSNITFNLSHDQIQISITP